MALMGLLLSLIMGMLSYVPRGDLTEILYYGIIIGVLVFAVPMFISSLLFYAVGKIKSPIFSLSRSLAFSLIFVAIWEFLFFLGSFTSAFFGISEIFIIATLFGAAFIYALCLVILITISTFGNPLSILLSSILPILGITFFALIMGNFKNIFLIPWLLYFAIAAAILTIPNFVAFYMIEKPVKRRIGVSGYELIRGFFLEWILRDSQKIESITDKFGEKADLPALLLVFRSKNNQKLKGIIFSSFIHYGPFKETGSSALPILLSQKIEKKNNTILTVTHGACTHGQNLCSTKETRRAINKIIKELDRVEFNTLTTPFIRVHEKDVKIISAILGNIIILISTRALEITDDINLKVGLSALEMAHKEMEKHSLKNNKAFLVDSHNCILDREVLIEPDTPAAENLLKAVQKSIQELSKTINVHKIRYGVSRTKYPEFYREYGLGELGITVNLIETSWSDGKRLKASKKFQEKKWRQRTALIVIDGNNMIIGLRNKIISRLLEEKLVDEAEVLTTDTHTVNASSMNQPDYYPVGRAINHDDLIEEILKNTKKALEDLEEVEIGAKIFNINNLKIWTDKKLNMFLEGIEETANTLKKITIPFFVSGVSLALLWLILVV